MATKAQDEVPASMATQRDADDILVQAKLPEKGTANHPLTRGAAPVDEVRAHLEEAADADKEAAKNSLKVAEDQQKERDEGKGQSTELNELAETGRATQEEEAKRMADNVAASRVAQAAATPGAKPVDKEEAARQEKERIEGTHGNAETASTPTTGDTGTKPQPDMTKDDLGEKK